MSTDWERNGLFSGCYYMAAPSGFGMRQYLPLVQSEFHSTILSNTVHTTLEQTFSNPTKDNIETCKYIFPLYEGISVVGFTCQIADRYLTGVVKEKEEAKATFDRAVARGESAGLLEQSYEASDVFSTSLGNVAAGQWVHVNITYVGELKNDLETDGIRLTIPTIIAPRYGSGPNMIVAGEVPATERGGIKITVDVSMPDDSPIRSVQSPSHPIAVSLGTLSSQSDKEDPSLNRASATLSLGETALEKDFVLMVQAKDTGIPKALLERHSVIKDHRALAATLVPKFSLPAIRPEIVFVADRSGSMASNIPMLKDAMCVFLKSLPDGVKFNICSFGSNHSFLWSQSQSYTKGNFDLSLQHIETFDAHFGGTETLSALKTTIEQRLGDMPLEIILLTDGDIWDQEHAFTYIHEQVQASKGQIRVFPLGIGTGVSHALIEGLARSGCGFAQAVQHGERLDGRVVRMLRGALSPHINDYTLEIKYGADDDDDFEVIDKVSDSLKVTVVNDDVDIGKPSPAKKQKKTVSLHDASVDPDKEERVEDYLPDISVPKLLQAPYLIPSLFSFSRTTLYMLMSPETIRKNPTSVVLNATSNEGPLSLEIPIQVLDQPGQTIHQLAARKAVQDLEEGRGWIHDARDEKDMKFKERFGSRFEDVVKREAVRLGTKFQVANRWCSFVAVESEEEEHGKQSKHKGNLINSRSNFLGKYKYKYSQLTNLRLAPDRRFSQVQYVEQTHKTGGPGGTKSFLVPVPTTQLQQQFMQGQQSLSRSAQAACSTSPSVFHRSQIRELAAHNAPVRSTSTASNVRFRGPSGGCRGGSRSTVRGRGGGCGRGSSSGSPVDLQYRRADGTRASTAAASASTGTAKLLRSGADDEDSGEDVGFCLIDDGLSFSAYSGPSGGSTTVSSQGILSSSEKVHALIALQQFEGFWSAADKHRLAELIDRSETEFDLGRYSHIKINDNDVWTTALVVAFLEQQLGSEKGVWEMVVEKARKWMDEQVKEHGLMQKTMHQAEHMVKGVFVQYESDEDMGF